MLAEAVAEREEVVLAVVALALADRAVEARVEALAVRAPERVGVRFGREYLSGHDSVVQDSTVSLRLVPLPGVMTTGLFARLRSAPRPSDM